MALPRRIRSNVPIPGTQPPPRALFIDRWGTLLEPSEHGFPRFDDVRFVAGSLEALFRLAGAPWRIYLIGNEDEVAQGRVPDREWSEFEAALLEHLRKQGIRVARNYACVEDPLNGVAPHNKCSVFRLPDTGIFFHAQQMDGVHLRQSFVIGDSSLELAAGYRAGCRTIGVETGAGCRDGKLDIEPELMLPSLTQAVELFLSSEAYSVR
ncbi:MAG: HAD hydrolase-like protein [Planctomycetes bacterium]|nr:HAD hydrolase-like protein [Planctomycetota bacterium]